MTDRYKKIEVTCPFCNTSKILDIPTALFLQKQSRIINIQVSLGAVCSDHRFVIFLDTNGTVRGYERIDVNIVEPQMDIEREGVRLLTLNNWIKIFGTYSLFSLLHAKIFNYPIFIVIDKNEDLEYNSDNLNSFGNLILPERYRGGRTIHLYEESDYDNIELNIKDGLLLDMRLHISKIPWDEKLKFEEFLVEKALEIINEQEQLVLIQQIISKFIDEAECALTILEVVSQISKKELIKEISRKIMTQKINNYRLNLIIEFINRRFSPKLTAKIGKLKKI